MDTLEENAHPIRITSQGKIKNWVTFALNSFEVQSLFLEIEGNTDSILIGSVGKARCASDIPYDISCERLE
jgi:hypothetical protein